MSQGVDDGAMLVIGDLHRPRQNEPTAAEQMKLGFQRGIELDELRIVGEFDQQPVQFIVQRVESGDVGGGDGDVHPLDGLFQQQ